MTTHAPGEFERFAIIRVQGHVPPADAIFHGSWDAMMEHVPGSRVIKQKLQIINDAAHEQSKLQALRENMRLERAQLDADKAALRADHAGFNHDLVGELSRRVQELEVRLAQYEAKQNQDPDGDTLPSPPGYPSPPFLGEREPPPGTSDIAAQLPTANADADDDGELQSPAPTPGDRRGEFLRLKKPLSLDDEEEFPSGELPHPPVSQQPTPPALDEE